jgi:methionine-rich copper-binding protein CopC
MNRRLLLGLALLATAFTAGAHTTVKSAEPADGAVLDRSPPSIEIKFEHAVQMTSVSVVAEHAAERKLTFAPTTGGTVIKVENPALAAGHNEIHWKALSKDGHVISGKLTYTVKPAVAGQ